MTIDIFKIIREATKAVPATKYAVGIAGLVAVLSLIFSIGIDWRIALWGTIVLIALMTVLVVFARMTTLAPAAFLLPIQLLMWSMVFLFIVICVLLTTSVFFKYPVDLQHVLVGATDNSINDLKEADFEKSKQIRSDSIGSFTINFTNSLPDTFELNYTGELYIHGPDIPGTNTRIASGLVKMKLPSDLFSLTIPSNDTVSIKANILNESKLLEHLIAGEYFGLLSFSATPKPVRAEFLFDRKTVEAGIKFTIKSTMNKTNIKSSD